MTSRPRGPEPVPEPTARGSGEPVGGQGGPVEERPSQEGTQPTPAPSRRLLVTAVLVGWVVVGVGILALAATGAVALDLALAAIGLTLIGDLLVLAVLVRSVDRAGR